MADKLERLYEYRTLAAKREALRLPLPADEAGRLEVTIRQVTTYRQSFGGEMRFVAIALWLGAFPSIAFAHHSVAALYDYSDVREMEALRPVRNT